ncbi:MAG TPA: 30S ribosomal protein S3 [Candidatus Nanoarchaeia archaeon]|nr:30S ribosomal protein S3 [Candidatus Nanoarchaeia archaeon]
MIERKFVNQNIKEFEIKEYIRTNLQRVGLSDVKLQRTPLGEKIIISTSRPGLVVGRSGTNITKLTKDLKEVFKLENPQIEIEEVTSLGLDANIIAEMIANSLERFGVSRFKGIAHKAMSDVLTAGAFGIEILISGKVPSARAKTWRFYQGYLKKCGDIAVSKIRVAYSAAQLKSGTIGVKVSIMTQDTVLPDKIKIIQEKEGLVKQVEEVKDASFHEELKEKIMELTGEQSQDQSSAPPNKALPKKKKGKQGMKEAEAKKTKKEQLSPPDKKRREQEKTRGPPDVASLAAPEEEERKNEI